MNIRLKRQETLLGIERGWLGNSFNPNLQAQCLSHFMLSARARFVYKCDHLPEGWLGVQLIEGGITSGQLIYFVESLSVVGYVFK